MREIILGIDGWHKRVEVTEEVFRSGVVEVYFPWLRHRTLSKAANIYQTTYVFYRKDTTVAGLPYFEAQI